MRKKSGLLTHICRQRKVCAFSGWWWWEGSGRWWWTPVASTCVDVCAPLRCTPLKWVAAVLIAPDWLSPIRINYKIASSAAERQRNQLIDCDQLQLRWDEKEREREWERESMLAFKRTDEWERNLKLQLAPIEQLSRFGLRKKRDGETGWSLLATLTIVPNIGLAAQLSSNDQSSGAPNWGLIIESAVCHLISSRQLSGLL